MSTTTVVLSRLDRRRAILAERLERVLLTQARGEGSTTWLELELILDEMTHLRDLHVALWLDAARRRLEADGALAS